MDCCRGYVVEAMQAHMHREQKADNDLVGKHDQRLNSVESIACER